MPSSDGSDVWYLLPLTELEAGFDAVGFQRWFSSSSVWRWCFELSAAYVLLVFVGRRLMRDREPFRLRLPLVLWNGGLAVFSTLGAVRSIAALMHSVQQHGFVRSVCDEHFTQPVTGFWTAAFVFSKVVEFGNTAVLVLRKEPVFVLNWYHHALTCIYTWYCYAYLVAPASYFIAISFSSQILMYVCDAARAAGYRLPTGVSILVSLQTPLQLVAGLYIVAVAHMADRAGEPCGWSGLDSLLAATMYGSYLLLFLYKYIVSKPPRSKKE